MNTSGQKWEGCNREITVFISLKDCISCVGCLLTVLQHYCRLQQKRVE